MGECVSINDLFMSISLQFATMGTPLMHSNSDLFGSCNNSNWTEILIEIRLPLTAARIMEINVKIWLREIVACSLEELRMIFCFFYFVTFSCEL